MPAGVPTATFAIGPAGAANAGLFAVKILALSDPVLAAKLDAHRETLREKAREGSEEVQKRRLRRTR
jgi:5-(carboxyamino)imidazole ribonucleotide mutase